MFKRILWLRGLRARPEEEVSKDAQKDALFSLRPDKTGITINALDADLVEFMEKFAAAEGDPLSVFMRKRLLEGFGAYLASKNRNAWKAHKLIGEARENF